MADTRGGESDSFTVETGEGAKGASVDKENVSPVAPNFGFQPNPSFAVAIPATKPPLPEPVLGFSPEIKHGSLGTLHESLAEPQAEVSGPFHTRAPVFANCLHD